MSARSFDEYVAMFALTDADLSGAILDCPGGAASFAAEARRAGVVVTSVDPVYAGDPAWLATHAVDEAVRGNRHTELSSDSYLWEFFTDITDHLAKRTTAARIFGEDLLTRPRSYVAAALPRLPFRDRTFDLVLSSHLLFMYADRLDDQFHIAAAFEMARVASRQVRIFPLIADHGTDTRDLIDGVRRALSSAGYPTEIMATAYEFQRGGNEMLVIDASPSSTGFQQKV